MCNNKTIKAKDLKISSIDNVNSYGSLTQTSTLTNKKCIRAIMNFTQKYWLFLKGVKEEKTKT